MSIRITDPKEIERLIGKGMIDKSNQSAVKSSLKKQRQLKEANSSESLLYNLLLPIYGDYFEGGELVKEFKPLSDRKYRIDVAMPNYGSFFEVDGLLGHSTLANGKPNLEGFRRDRTKDLLMTSHGWHVLRLMRSHITKEPQLVIDAVQALIANRSYKRLELTVNKSGICEILA